MGIITTSRQGSTTSIAVITTPQVGRFINADTYVSTGQGLTGFNMFAYCLNNPVMHIDPSGCYSADWFIYTCANKTVQVEEYDPRNFELVAFIRVIEDMLKRFGPAVIRTSYLDYYIYLVNEGLATGNGTLSLNIGFNAFFITGGVAYTLDKEGNFEIQHSLGVSSSASLDVSIGLSITTAENCEALKGWEISSQIKYGPIKGGAVLLGGGYGNGYISYSASIGYTWIADPREQLLYSRLGDYLSTNETYSITYTF